MSLIRDTDANVHTNTDRPTPTTRYPECSAGEGYFNLSTVRHSNTFKIYSEGLEPWWFPGIDKKVRLRYPSGWKYYEGDNKTLTQEKAARDQRLIPKTTSTPNNHESTGTLSDQIRAMDASISEVMKNPVSIPKNNGFSNHCSTQKTAKEASMAEFFQLSSDEMLVSIAEKNKKVQNLMAELERKNQEIKHCMAVHELKLENMAFKG